MARNSKEIKQRELYPDSVTEFSLDHDDDSAKFPPAQPGGAPQFCSRAEKKSISKKNKYLENFFRN